MTNTMNTPPEPITDPIVFKSDPPYKALQVSNNIRFYPHDNSLPTTSSTDNMIMVLQCPHILLNSPDPPTPFLGYGTELNHCICQIDNHLSQAHTSPNHQVPTKPKGTPLDNTPLHQLLRSNTAPSGKIAHDNLVKYLLKFEYKKKV